MPLAVSSLAEFVRRREPEERCDTCGAPLGAEHAHMFAPAARQIKCACDSCAILYSGTFKRIPSRATSLPEFQMSDAQWDELAIPIGLAFFSYSTAAGRVVAMYPGPAGAAESLLSLDAWEEIANANPAIRQMEPDVEALLVNRIGAARDHYLAPIDECYRLVGLIRMHWRGLSGGAKVWGELARFFAELRQRGEECRA
jgi:hypothetical protein